jgi:formylglycine-generating enzyme
VIRMLADDSLYDLKGKRQTLRDFMGFSRQETDKVLANEDDSLPMYFVSWTDAREFCQKLNNREKTAGRLPKGYEYTLPTEAQWEFACRAGSTTASFAGPVVIRDGKSAVLDNLAWYKANSALGYVGRGLDHPLAGPRQSGEKSPNALGLQDMLGNLWEWCLDWYGPYSGGQLTDPVGPGSGVERVNRGGSWGSGAADERSANRAANPPPEKSAYRGFRLALTRIPGWSAYFRVNSSCVNNCPATGQFPMALTRAGLALFFYRFKWQRYCELFKTSYMTDQKNKHTTSEDKNAKNQSDKNKNSLDKEKGARKAFKKEDMPDPDEKPATESELDPDSPEKKIQIDDDPEGTKKKIPHI